MAVNVNEVEQMMPAQLWFSALVLGGMYALLALGLGLIYNTTRLFDFSFGGVYLVAAYATYQLLDWTNLGVLPIIVLSALTGMAVGLTALLIVYRSLIQRKAPFLGFAIATLGVAIVLENLIAYLYSPVTRTVEASGSIGTFQTNLGPIFITGVQILILVVALAAMASFLAFFRFTRTGLDLRAVASDTDLAEAKGVERLRSAYIAFAVGYFLAGVAAVLITFETHILVPSVGHNMVVIAIVGVLIGGATSTPAAAIGGLVLAVTTYHITWWFGEQWADPVVYSALILLLVVRPQGLLGRRVSFVGR